MLAFSVNNSLHQVAFTTIICYPSHVRNHEGKHMLGGE